MEKKRKVWIIAPHPDDEINLAGQMLVHFQKQNLESYVMYTTNGDAEKKINNKRIYEALEACKVLGVGNSYVFFLGYANGWKEDQHIYNAKYTSERESLLGKRETNGVKGKDEFSLLKYGIHHLFTRENLKNDFKTLILDILPDLIIAPEFDLHPDHRMTSLLFDEIMGEILKSHRDYRPLILKKYIHEGVWYGKKDYYSIPMNPTLTGGMREYSGGTHELSSPSFTWGERLAFETDERTRTKYLQSNIIFKAAKKHRCTTAWYEMQRVINADMVYWQRRTDSLLFSADITATSGNTCFLNDFLLYGCHDIKKKEEPFTDQTAFEWIPSEDDPVKCVFISLQKYEHISSIVIYEDCNWDNHIEKVRISQGDNVLYEGELNRDGTGTNIRFKREVLTDKLSIQVIKYCGVPGITEIEVFADEYEKERFQEYRLKKYEYGIGVRDTGRKSAGQLLEKVYLTVLFAFKFKIRYEIGRRICQKS